MNLVTLADVKSFLEVTSSEHDALLNLIIGDVSARVEQFLNRSLEKKERTVYFDAGRRIFSLPAYPIDSSAALTVIFDDETQTVNDDYWVWHDSGVVEFQDTPAYSEPKQISITWTGGYTDASDIATNLPSLSYAVLMQCAYVFRRRKDLGLSSVSMPDGAVAVADPANLLKDVRAALLSLRRKPIG